MDHGDTGFHTGATMRRRMFESKIHRATVTHADLHYDGSFSIDRLLMKAANIINSEEVHVWNVTRGTRPTRSRLRPAAASFAPTARQPT